MHTDNLSRSINRVAGRCRRVSQRVPSRRVGRVVLAVLCVCLVVVSGVVASGVGMAAPQDGDGSDKETKTKGSVIIDLDQEGPVTVTKLADGSFRIMPVLGNSDTSWHIKERAIYYNDSYKGWPGRLQDLTRSEQERLEAEIKGVGDDYKGAKDPYNNKIKPYLKQHGAKAGAAMVMVEPNERFYGDIPLTVTKLKNGTILVFHNTKSWTFKQTQKAKENGNYLDDGKLLDSSDGWNIDMRLTSEERVHLGGQIQDTTKYQSRIESYLLKRYEQKDDDPKDTANQGILDAFDPVENFKNLVDAMFGIPEWLIEQANAWIFGVPAPGQPTKPQSWVDPQNGIWPGIADFTTWTTAFATVVMMFSGGTTFFRTDAYARRQAWKRWGIALVMILGTWTLLPLGLHTANEITSVLTPSTSEIFKSWGSISKVGTGVGLMAVFAFFQIGVFGVAAFVLAVERIIIFFAVGLWPLAWALRSMENDIGRSLGQLTVFLLVMVIATKIGQALMARMLFSLDWGGFGSSVVMLLVIGAGLAFILIYFPKKMLEHANDAANISLGMSKAADTSGKVAERASERIGREEIGRAYESLQDWRGGDGDSESSIPEHKQQVGQTGRTRDDPDRPDYSTMDSFTFSSSSPFSSEWGEGGIDAEHRKRDTERIDDMNRGYY